MRTCSACGKTKQVEAFGFRDARTGELWGRCRDCRAAYQNAWYLRNKAEIIARSAAHDARVHVSLRNLITDLKAGPCIDCGGCFPKEAMDFDHVRGTKRQNISRLVTRAVSVQTIMAEIAKCDLVCANCHRGRTWQRRHGLAQSSS